MSQYHVFLPPATLSPLDGAPIPRLVFEQLEAPKETQSQNAWSQQSSGPRFPPPPSGVLSNASGVSERPDEVHGRKRETRDDSRAISSSVKRSRGPLRKLQTEVVADTSRRRSMRLGRRTSEGLLGTLPGQGIDITDSYLSLNTTVSDASQPFPPTADQSSLLNFPRWSIPLTKLSTLPALLAASTGRGKKEDEGVCLIVCVLSVDQVVQRQRKEEKARGEEGSLWIGKWTVTCPPGEGGAQEVGSCAVKLWDKAAREWGDEKVRRGDIVLLENVRFTRATPKDPAHITISDQTRPRITVLYRTIPRYHSAVNAYQHTTKDQAGAKMVPEDRLLRPDLRLGRSDMGVRKVGEVVRWFANFIGGDAPA